MCELAASLGFGVKPHLLLPPPAIAGALFLKFDRASVQVAPLRSENHAGSVIKRSGSDFTQPLRKRSVLRPEPCTPDHQAQAEVFVLRQPAPLAFSETCPSGQPIAVASSTAKCCLESLTSRRLGGSDLERSKEQH